MRLPRNRYLPLTRPDPFAVRLCDFGALERDPRAFLELQQMAWDMQASVRGAMIGAVHAATIANEITPSFADRLSSEACEALRGGLHRVGGVAATLASIEMANKIAQPGKIELRFHNVLSRIPGNFGGEVGESLAARFVCEAAYFACRTDAPDEQLLLIWHAAVARGLLAS